MRKSRLLILKQGPKQRAGLASKQEAKSLDENFDEETARNAGGTATFLIRTDTMTLLFTDFSLGFPLRPVNSLLVVRVRGKFIRQIFLNGHPSKFALVS